MTLVSDNGTQFVSEETEVFLRLNKIKHVTVPTYSPKSNGICERFVGTFKAAMLKMKEQCSDVNRNLADFLLTYRNTPHSVTHQPPAVLAYNRTLRFNLHRIKPADKMKIDSLQSEKQQKVIDSEKTSRSFEENQKIYVQLDKRKTWVPATIVRRHGPASNVYDIDYQGRTVKKHADKIKHRYIPVLEVKKQQKPIPDHGENLEEQGPSTEAEDNQFKQLLEHSKTVKEQKFKEYLERKNQTVGTDVHDNDPRDSDKEIVETENHPLD